MSNLQTPVIDRRRRFVFRGNAAAVGGRIVRPTDLIFESHVASSLTVAGGRSTASGKNLDYHPYATVDSAKTSAEGLFANVTDHEALTHRTVTADALTTRTQVSADVHGVRVGLDPILRIKGLHATLRATSPAASGEPAIQVDGNIEDFEPKGHNVEIGNCKLRVTLAPAIFQQHDTHSKLMVAADNPGSGIGKFLLLHSDMQPGKPLPPIGRLFRGQDTVYATLVESIEWVGAAYPGSTVTDHTVRVPGFGKLVFAELLLTSLSRRLTLLRLELGSPEGGDVAFAEVESNGIWT